jgi:hypothetical protein
MKAVLLIIIFVFCTCFNTEMTALPSIDFGVVGRRWYVGGTFTQVYQADGTVVSSNYFASWNGTGWVDIGSGTNGKVNAIYVDPCKNVYIGGAFTTAGRLLFKLLKEVLQLVQVK